MGLSEGAFPDYRAIKAGNVQLPQEMNNMYIAVTRAKRLCYMTYPAKKMQEVVTPLLATPWQQKIRQPLPSE